MPSCELYLDHAATSPMSHDMAQKLCHYLSEYPFNSETVYEWGLSSKRALEEARERISKKFKWKHELIFTSGGTEGNNLAIHALKGLKPGVLWVSQTAHPSLTKPIHLLGEQGWEVCQLPIAKTGALDLQAIKDLPEPSLVALEWVNSEVGFIQPIEALADWLKQSYPNSKIVIDAVQGVGKLSIPILKDIDAFIFSGHKFGGPVGVGGLIFKAPKNITPLQLGGGQESGWRSGTVALANILCMRDALFEAYDKLESSEFEAFDIFDRKVGVSYSPFIGLINTKPVDGEVLLHQLESKGIAIGLGSACQASRKKPSRTLELLGYEGKEARQTLRLSWTPHSDRAKIMEALKVYKQLHQESCKYFK